MRILITGGAGFIGSAYTRALLAGDLPGSPVAAVTVLDNLSYSGNLTNLTPVASHPAYTFVHGDICDADLADQLMAGHDAVVHFAAESHVDRSISSAGFTCLITAGGSSWRSRPGGQARSITSVVAWS